MGWKNSALIIFSTSQCGFGIFIEDSNGWCKLLNVSSLLGLLCWGAQHCCVEHTVPWANRAVWSAALPFARAGELLSFPGTQVLLAHPWGHGCSPGLCQQLKAQPCSAPARVNQRVGNTGLFRERFFGVSSTSAPTEGKPTMLEHTLNAVKLLGTGIFLHHLPFLLILK